jgi:hypothetical protein
MDFLYYIDDCFDFFVWLKDIYPIINIFFIIYIARYITKHANLEIKKRELIFSVAKDFEFRIESLFKELKVIFEANKIDATKSRQIQIELKLLSNLHSIIMENFKTFVDEQLLNENKINYDYLRDLISEIEAFHREDTQTMQKDIINQYSKFLGSFIKVKFELLNP